MAGSRRASVAVARGLALRAGVPEVPVLARQVAVLRVLVVRVRLRVARGLVPVVLARVPAPRVVHHQPVAATVAWAARGRRSTCPSRGSSSPT